jgi:hypothetical protein
MTFTFLISSKISGLARYVAYACIPANPEMEIGGLWAEAGTGKKHKMLSEK